MTQRTFLFVLAWLIIVPGLCAQEWIKLTSGKTLRGEIVDETAEGYRLIDMNADIHMVKKADVKRAKSRKFKAPVQSRLETINAKDPASLVELAKWASENKKLAKDGPRLLLRALASNPEFKEARELLGHIKIKDRWFRGIDGANAALEKEMTAKGMVLHKAAWVKAELKEALAQALKDDPESWMKVDLIYWRLTDDVLRERGYKRFEGVWYAPEEVDLIPQLKKLKKQTDEVAHAARVGSVEVYHVGGKEVAQTHAEKIMKARTWFCEAFKLQPSRNPLLTEPISKVYVLSSMAALSKFAAVNAKAFKLSETEIAFSMGQKHIHWKHLGHATTLQHRLWKPLIVAQMGGDATNLVWHFRYPQPAWIWVACANNAEIAVLGSARMEYLAPDEYGRKRAMKKLSALSLKDLKSIVSDLAKDKSMPSMRRLFGAAFNELDSDMVVTGIVLLNFMLEVKEKEFRRFMSGRTSGDDVHSSFAKCFGAPYSVIGNEFKLWLRK